MNLDGIGNYLFGSLSRSRIGSLPSRASHGLSACQPRLTQGRRKPQDVDAFQVKSVSESRFVRKRGVVTDDELDEIASAVASCVGRLIELRTRGDTQPRQTTIRNGKDTHYVLGSQFATTLHPNWPNRPSTRQAVFNMIPFDRSRRSFLKTSVAFGGTTPLMDGRLRVQAAEAAGPLIAYVGTFSSPLRDVLPTQVDRPPGNGRGIHLFRVDRATGAMTPSGIHEMGTSPSCLASNISGTPPVFRQ